MDCSIRSLWQAVQNVVDQVLSKTTLTDLLRNEQEMTSLVSPLVQITDGTPKSSEAPTPASLEARSSEQSD